MNRRLALVSLTVAVATLIVAPTTAEAKKKPSQRARIHALEKHVDVLEDTLADDEELIMDLITRMARLERTATETNTIVTKCLFGLPMQTSTIASLPLGSPVQVFALNFEAPGAWMASINSGCIGTNLGGVAARALVSPRVGSRGPG